VGGGLLAFSRALGEFGAVVVVAGNIPNQTLTAPVFISQLVNGNPDAAAAVSALLFGVAFLLVLVTEKLVKRHVDVLSA
jgi:sulfate transport system permease protein